MPMGTYQVIKSQFKDTNQGWEHMTKFQKINSSVLQCQMHELALSGCPYKELEGAWEKFPLKFPLHKVPKFSKTDRIYTPNNWIARWHIFFSPIDMNVICLIINNSWVAFFDTEDVLTPNCDLLKWYFIADFYQSNEN